MEAANISYEKHIVKTVINNHLDRILSEDANKALYLIQYQIDNLVWSIATSIYRQSGHKVDFSSVRDLANTRIKSLKMLAVRQAEEIIQKALKEEAKKIEEARLKAEAEAKRKAEEKAKKIEETRREQEINERRKVEEERQKQEITKTRNICLSKGINYETFEKIKSITADQLEVDPNRITPEVSFANDLGADVLDMIELIMAIEEEFEIELPENNFIKRRPLFSSAQEDEYVYSWVTVEDFVRLVEKKIS